MNISNTPTWLSDVDLKTIYPKLENDISCDIVIIGAGLAGITTAYLLSKTGKSIVLIEKESIAKTATTGYTTAFITYIIDTSLSQLIKIFNKEKARQVWSSGNDAINLIEHIVTKEKINCEFMRCSEHMYANSTDQIQSLQEETKLGQALGFDVSWHESNNLNFKNYGYMEVANQAKFHPIKYLQQLTQRVSKNKVQIFESTEAKKIKAGKQVEIHTPGGTITSQDVVITTYGPFNHPLSVFFKEGRYTSYILETKLPKNTLEEALYLDQENPYHYFRIDKKRSYDRLILGGEDNRSQIPVNPEKGYRELEKYLQNIIPNVKYEVTRKWNGVILEPVDGLPYIGRLSNNQFIATGFSGNGMTYSTISAMLLTDLILRRKNTWADLYDPTRTPSIKQLLEKGKDYTGEFLGAAAKNIFTK